jgi:hypothetical protein
VARGDADGLYEEKEPKMDSIFLALSEGLCL